jgi:hypothetical protein
MSFRELFPVLRTPILEQRDRGRGVFQDRVD